MKYLIYALIHGETLPKEKMFGCEIGRMSFAEQKKKGFFSNTKHVFKRHQPKF